MSRFTAIVCDHCDARDVLENPPQHDIKPVAITVCVDKMHTTEDDICPVDLCKNCRSELRRAIMNAITQVPRAA